ncbi:MAG: prolyl oligopeptidase family serine peptidase [Candidatus Thorarchaeota archaeon]|nr:prolyl oligopeptidase family serine peptidase [Candidatus Thorarchaeota archaeon]
MVNIPHYGTSLLLVLFLLLIPTANTNSFVPNSIIRQSQDVIHYQRREGVLPAPSLSGNLVGCPTEQPYVVFLPPNYDNTTANFPTVYFLHGFSTSATSFRNTFLDLNYPQDMIVVVVNGRTTVGGSFYENSEVTGNWEDYVVHDVVSFIDEHFRTIRNASYRGISGLSMGGYSALNIAMKHPDVFSSVFAISPGLFCLDGIEESQIYKSVCINYMLDLETELAAQENDSIAHSIYLERLNNLIPSDDRLFSLAYGSAFAPNANKRAPYIDYIFYRDQGTIYENHTSRLQWEAGFGGIQEEVGVYKDKLRSLKAIGIEFSDLDMNSWIPKGCRYYNSTLRSFNITLTITNTTYGHANYLSERIEEYMLPFFSDVFQSIQNTQSQAVMNSLTIGIVVTVGLTIIVMAIVITSRNKVNALSTSILRPLV